MKYISSIFFFLISCALHATIIESNAIEQVLDVCDQETLVIFDLNNTLMETTQVIGSDPWASYLVKKQMKETGKSREEVLHTFVPTWHRILIQEKVNPVEPSTSSVIQKLQKKKIPLLGLTARYVEMAYPTHEQLHSIGIDLSQCIVYPYNLEILGGYASKFIEGVIFVGLKNDKGETLVRFLDQINYHPKKVVFIDDKLKNLHSVENALEKKGISFLGIRYGCCDPKVQNFDEKSAEEEWEMYQKTHSLSLND